ncbi:MAG: winged helix-turn-helix domain-containing protein, partial [Microlunatus sp.]|nr:winged helix-turn-helix domain-containing protein [Microlunatus sp.]
ASWGRIPDLLRRLDRADVGPTELVVDDLHELSGTAAEAALETFIRLRPHQITIALGSRRQPGLNTSRLLVSGELVLFDAEDLRFRSWEVEQLFRSVYQTPLSPEAAAALTRRTGGWAAGLQLFHLATVHLGRAGRERAVTELTGRSRLIRSYLARNVLAGLAPERRRFLLLTCALGALTGDLCDALLDTTGSAAALADLEREQFFTTTTDDGLTYHYHQVLQTHLEVLLIDELGTRAARDHYSRSGRLLEQGGRVSEAVRAHARAEDWGAVARLMRPGTSVVVDADDPLWRMLALPGAPTDDPGLVLAGARRLARDGQLSSAIQAYRDAERLLDDPAFGRRCLAERQAIAIWLPPPSNGASPRLPTSNDPESQLLRLSIELRRLTRDVRRPESFDRGWLRGLAYALAGDLGAAEDELEQLEPVSRPGTPVWRGIAAELTGCLIRAIRSPDEDLAGRVETITLAAEVDGWPWLARLGRSLQTMVQLHGPDEPWRMAAAEEELTALRRGEDSWTRLVAAVGIGVAARRVGERQLAGLARDQALRLARELDAPALMAVLARYQEQPRESMTSTTDSATRPGADHETVLRCLGGFSLSVAGTEADWRGLRPKARSLLMLLALHHGRPRHRELIIDALWPEATLSSGIRSLQVAVSSLRQCLSASGMVDEAIRRQDDAYALELPGVRHDVGTFEHLVEQARTQSGREALRIRRTALDHYRGELLPEVGPAEWVVSERERLQQVAASVAAAAAADAVALDDLGTAIELSRRSVTLDACHDPAWRLLVETYERVGDLSAAAVARADHQRVWVELGLAPRVARV